MFSKRKNKWVYKFDKLELKDLKRGDLIRNLFTELQIVDNYPKATQIATYDKYSNSINLHWYSDLELHFAPYVLIKKPWYKFW